MNDSPALRLLEEKFGPGKQPVLARAPGRVNLIGEHTDYNEGYVLPFAIDRFTEVALRPRHDSAIIVYSGAVDAVLHVKLPLRPVPQKSWQDYILGILLGFSEFFDIEQGFEAAIWSNVPPGAGLSSSAALEVSFALGLLRLYAVQIDEIALVRLCQRAERDFVGVPCGIMDQYTSYFARSGTALLIDTRYLNHQYVPLDLTEVTLLMIDSDVRRVLSSSGYVDRRRECQEAAQWLAQRFPKRAITSLRDVDGDLLEEVREEMPDVLFRRALHVVKENARVLAMVKALERGEWEEAGQLLYASHESLRDLFEVSLPEIDFLVEWAVDHGALGARLVGGGFGGATLHLVPKEMAIPYSEEISRAYRQRFGKKPTVLRVTPTDGAKFL